jgi:sulfite reductase (ferredoxin)
MSTNPESILHIPETVRADVRDYRSHVKSFLDGQTNAIAFRAYRVPMGIYEQRTAGRFMVRVRVGAGLVLTHQLKGIAELSRRHGDGVLHVTTRQDIQIHAVPIEKTPDVLEGLLEVGLTSRGGGGNTVRNITACGRCGVCPKERFNVAPHAIATAEYLLRFKTAYNLPRKFKLAFSGCADDCASASATDLGFIAAEKDGKRGFAVFAGGGLGGNPRAGIRIEEFVTAEHVFLVAEAMRRVFDQHGDRTNKHRARLRHVVERVGAAEFIGIYRRERERLSAEGLAPVVPAIPNLDARFQPIAAFVEGTMDVQEFQPRVDADRQAGYGTVRLPLPLGDISADDLVKVAEIAARFGVGLVHTTQFQDVLVPSVPYSRMNEALAALNGLSVCSQKNHRLKIVTCTGAATCKLGICLSRNLATAIEAWFHERRIDVGARPPVIRISGCPNSCGNHQIADIGLEGKVRRHQGRLMPCYGVLAGGKVGEDGAQLAQRIGTVPAKQVPELLARACSERRTDTKGLVGLVERFSELPKDVTEDFFVDFGSTEPFSLAGRGPGECGVGVLDIVRVDIDDARETLKIVDDTAVDRKKRDEAIYRALVTAARSLLVIFGQECRKDREIFRAFHENLIQPRWVAPETGELFNVALDWRLGDRDTLADQAEPVCALVRRVEELFLSLDGNLKFRAATVGKVASAAEAAGDREIDLRGVGCPVNFVKAKVALEKIPVGGTLEVLLDDGEPVRNVPASFSEQGQEVVDIRPADDHFRVSVRRKK